MHRPEDAGRAELLLQSGAPLYSGFVDTRQTLSVWVFRAAERSVREPYYSTFDGPFHHFNLFELAKLLSLEAILSLTDVT